VGSLTQLQYREDGISLTAAESRPIQTHHITPPTTGIKAVFEAASSLVFVCYDNREHTMVNPIEAHLIRALTTAIDHEPLPRPDGGADRALAGGPTTHDEAHPPANKAAPQSDRTNPTVGVVTPHNAQRGALGTDLQATVTANTVEKYQDGERDIIAVSATVSDPQFARTEERFILNPRRVLVAISRSRLFTTDDG